MTSYNIRRFIPGNEQAVLDIFNYFVENSYAAYPELKADSAFIEKLRELAIGGSLYVVEIPGQEVIGFGLLRRYHPCEAFGRTAELTYFILPEHTRRGVGSRLMDMLISDAKAAGIDTLMANLSSLNEASLAFHKKHGFVECGRFLRIGRKNNKDFDVVWMQRFI